MEVEKASMTHVDQHTLELYVLSASEVRQERAEIERHLAACPGCAALLHDIEEYHAEVEEMRQRRIGDKRYALTLRNVVARMPQFAVDRGRLRLPARVVVYLVRHPATTLVSLACLVAALLVFLTPRTAVKDANPAYARAKEEFLVVYNANGDELWRKHIGPGYDMKALGVTAHGEMPDQYLKTLDVDGDGSREVITTSGVAGELDSNAAKVLCFRANGSELWKFTQHGEMTFGDRVFDARHVTREFIAGTLGHSRRPNVWVLSVILWYYPVCLTQLSGKDGSITGRYWHSGVIMAFDHYDLDGDGPEEIFMGGQNNGYNLASLAVVDPDVVEGRSPAPPSHSPLGVPPGREKVYILLPRSDVGAFAVESSARVVGVSFPSPRHLMVTVNEDLGSHAVPMLFHFDSTMACTSVEGEAKFVEAHRKLEKERKLKRKLNAEYYEDLRRGVMYWNGREFLKIPCGNDRYKKELTISH